MQANNVFIVDKAALPDSPSSPRIGLSLLLSLTLGLGAGVAVAYVFESFDDIITSVEEIERLANIPSLGVIPLATAEGGGEGTSDPRSSLSEAYRSLCTSLQFTTERGLPKSLVVTSSGPGEGKSITSMAIAQHFARLGLKVLVVDADMRNPSFIRSCKPTINRSQFLFNWRLPTPGYLPENGNSQSCIHGLWSIAAKRR